MEELAPAPFHRLSGGEKQRVLIARAPAQLGVTSVVALHDLNLAAAFCDRICVMAGGRVVATGKPAEVPTAPLLSDVYGSRPR
ncbi:hypothetical protein ACFVYT_35525 [Streptomyces sp. NPDC058290]|uniref:hypothetical protein n=1 Tax=Streptomyces sp. NPDC058290 TaxID=3346426 RepID=UPI0036E2D2DF